MRSGFVTNDYEGEQIVNDSDLVPELGSNYCPRKVRYPVAPTTRILNSTKSQRGFQRPAPIAKHLQHAKVDRCCHYFLFYNRYRCITLIYIVLKGTTHNIMCKHIFYTVYVIYIYIYSNYTIYKHIYLMSTCLHPKTARKRPGRNHIVLRHPPLESLCLRSRLQ